MKKINTKKGIALWNKAKKIIPGGGQLLSKRTEVFLPGLWPSYYTRAKGAEVWDLDGNKYIDMCYMGIGCCVLGYADPDVDKAVEAAIEKGSMTTLNSPEEVELAQVLLDLHPWARMVRYARSGGEAMAIAARIARAASGKDKIAFCGYHGWADWYIAANLADDKNLDGHLIPGLQPRGIPRGLAGTMMPFHYNKIEELEKLVKRHKDIGVIVVEISRHQAPKDDFLKKVRHIADKIGAVLVFDEITIGWKLCVGGAHLFYGVNPDIAVFAKAIANGFPMAAIIGRTGVMEAAQTTFISSTFWTERIGPVAALATIKKMQKKNVPAHLARIGTMIGEGWKKLALKHGLQITVSGPPSLIEFTFDYGDQNQALRTLLTQEMLRRGFFDMGCVYVSYAHTPEHVKKYLAAADQVFGILAEAARHKTVHKLLEGPVAHNRFERIS